MDGARKVRSSRDGSAPPLARQPRRWADLLLFGLLIALTVAALGVLAAVGCTMAVESWPVVTEIGLGPFLLGTTWMPIDFGHGASYGIFNFVLATVLVSALALAFSFVGALGCAIYLACVARPAARTVVQSVTDLTAGVPSVVFGFVGLVVVVKAFIEAGHPSGACVLAAAFVLAVMLLPYMTSALAEAIEVQRKRYLRAALDLGTSRWFAIYAVLVPGALKNMAPSLMLAFGRAMGETMAVMMVIGNANLLPTLLGKAETIAALITLEMGTAAQGSLHMHALFGAGMVLLVIVFVVDALALRLQRLAGGGGRRGSRAGSGRGEHAAPGRGAGRRSSRMQGVWRLGKGGALLIRVWTVAATTLVLAAIAFLFGYVFWQGAPYVSWEFITQPPAGAILGTEGGIWPAIVGSAWFVGCSLVIAAPLAVGCALLRVFWLRQSRLGTVIGRTMAVAAGAPSIVCGLFAYAVIVRDLGLGRSIFAGGMALALMILPFIEVRAEKIFNDVPEQLISAALALGCSRAYVVRTLVLPYCARELTSGILLGGLYALGATAPLVFCGGVAFAPVPHGLDQPAMALPLHLYLMLAQGTTVPQVYATALVLMVIVLVVNVTVAVLSLVGSRQWQKS